MGLIGGKRPGRVIDSLNCPESGCWGRILTAMKVLIPVLIGLLVVGCEAPQAPENPTAPENPAEPVKLTAAEKQVVGRYEFKEGSNVSGLVLKSVQYWPRGNRHPSQFLRIAEVYVNDKKVEEWKWEIRGKEVLVENNAGYFYVHSIMNDGSLV